MVKYRLPISSQGSFSDHVCWKSILHVSIEEKRIHLINIFFYVYIQQSCVSL